jgi:hypothetical protein
VPLPLCVQPSFGYSKSSVFTADDCLTPHLEMETCVAGDGSKMLLYISMDPRLSLVRRHMSRQHGPNNSRAVPQVHAACSTALQVA